MQQVVLLVQASLKPYPRN